jgi:hypothetical protein
MAGLLGAGLKFLGRVALVFGEEWWSRRQDRKAATRLSHADAERQARAARGAGPQCPAVTRGKRCIFVAGHDGPHWMTGGES